MPFLSRRRIVVHIDANIAWQVARDEDSQLYIGVCPMLNLNATGETMEELTSSIQEAQGLLFMDLLEHGELAEFLTKHGWKMQGKLPRFGKKTRFDVPFALQQMGSVRDLVPTYA